MEKAKMKPQKEEKEQERNYENEGGKRGIEVTKQRN